jgi:hypothetical protein
MRHFYFRQLITFALLLCSAGTVAANELVRARQALEKKQFSVADRLISKTLRSTPRSAEAHVIKASIYEARKDYRSAVAELRVAASLDPRRRIATEQRVRNLTRSRATSIVNRSSRADSPNRTAVSTVTAHGLSHRLEPAIASDVGSAASGSREQADVEPNTRTESINDVGSNSDAIGEFTLPKLTEVRQVGKREWPGAWGLILMPILIVGLISARSRSGTKKNIGEAINLEEIPDVKVLIDGCKKLRSNVGISSEVLEKIINTEFLLASIQKKLSMYPGHLVSVTDAARLKDAETMLSILVANGGNGLIPAHGLTNIAGKLLKIRAYLSDIGRLESKRVRSHVYQKIEPTLEVRVPSHG